MPTRLQPLPFIVYENTEDRRFCAYHIISEEIRYRKKHNIAEAALYLQDNVQAKAKNAPEGSPVEYLPG